MALLMMDEDRLKAAGAYWTAKEIAQQPEIWAQLAVGQQSRQWLAAQLAEPGLRIILTGAGTSAYVGLSLAPYLSQRLGRLVEAISTTDLVANPDQYLLPQVPTLLVSYARSGNSPESVAAMALASQLCGQCRHLVISCNGEGELARLAGDLPGSHCLLMPPQTLDQSFAMTSSFSTMLLATLQLFGDQEGLDWALAASRHILAEALPAIRELAERPFTRVAFLGAGVLKGIATEAALKMLELSAGRVDAHAETPLGFRHGPKSMVDADTLVVLLDSGQPHCQLYDQDLHDELARDGKALALLRSNRWLQGGLDPWRALPSVLLAQLLAFHKSLALGISPDNPCPTGEVNRVVQGVRIHRFEG
ncbi:SIS domain-containing protein [Gallaecimonas xiamenensis]|uniref:Tagatose-6-phosphate ketose/aldose isomerase n=1 Tax=Gallaecimonas xiamenensis 3-C-1 TaxID=745411 RepID=K2K3J0_9GAMM|nr:SIS domain-containing protein [Gallaecimonas xiamenensis]EKE77529.1 tagatose-6-phosphate ketose/aldose isomerase [Gallaecimonas xiamenensis 3-C-1]